MIAFLVLLFGLILVWGAGSSGLINLGDSLFPFFPQERLQQLLYVWNGHNILGKDNSAVVPQLTWHGLAALLDKLGFPLVFINRLWFVLPFLLLGFAMHFLSGIVFGEEKKVSRLIATLFFLFNPFTLNLVAGSNILTLSFAAGVFVFALFLRGLEKSTPDLKDVLPIGLASIFASANIVVWIITLLLCSFYFFFFALVNRRQRPRLISSIKFLLFAGCYLLLANSWWLLPFVSQILHSGYFQNLFAVGTDVGTLEFISQFTSLFDVSRLFYGMIPTANFPISAYYHYLLAPTVMSVLAVLVFAVSLFGKKNKFEVFFLLLAWVSVVLASGTRPPFGFVYQFLWDHIPYFHIFRTTNRFNLWTMVSYAVLLGFLYQRLGDFFEKLRRQPLISYALFLILISIFLSAWPLLSGDVLGQLKPRQIPRDYYQLREFLKSQEGDFRVMSLPRTDWLATYSWNAPFDMQEILIDFSDKDTIVNLPGYLQNLKEREPTKDDPPYAMVYKNPDRPEALDALRLMGVKYLVLHHDYVVVWGNYHPLDVAPIVGVLKKIEAIKLVQSFGDLDVYEVADVAPRVFPTSGEASYVKINPIEYQVTVKNATEPFTLVLTENFHPGWESSLGDHIKFANFANGWEINEAGDFEITLKYGPQRLLDAGLIASVLGVATGLLILLHLKSGKK